MATEEESIIERIKSIYSELKGKVFFGDFENSVTLCGNRIVIRIDKAETEMIQKLTSMLEMEKAGDKEVVWKAITQGVSPVTHIYGTRLWCNENSGT